MKLIFLLIIEREIVYMPFKFKVGHLDMKREVANCWWFNILKYMPHVKKMDIFKL